MNVSTHAVPKNLGSTVDQNSGDIHTTKSSESQKCVSKLPGYHDLSIMRKETLFSWQLLIEFDGYLRSLCVCKGTISHKSGCTLLSFYIRWIH